MADDRAPGVLRDVRAAVRDSWGARELVVQLTLRDVRVRYKQALMGFAWAVLSPLLVVAAGTLMRAALLRAGPDRFDAAALAGVAVKGLAWSFVAGAVGFSTSALTGNGALISKVYFPREVLPLSAVLASAFDALVGAAALGLLLPAAGWRPTWAALWAPALALVLFALALAAALVVSCANVFFRDVKHLVQLFVTFGIFFTPVFYEPAAVGGRWGALAMLNPVAPLLEGLRLSVVDGRDLLVAVTRASDGAVLWTPLYLAYSAAWAAGALLVGAAVFRRAHARFAEYV